MASKSGRTPIRSTSSTLRLARTFLRSFANIKSQEPAILPSPPELRRRSRRIKMMAYSSMARTAGPRCAWARALLFKLRTRARHRTLITRRRHHHRSDDRVGKLRRLVPGGESMDVCTLLEETGEYIQCLSAQVKVMKAICDHQFSTN
ncbi:Transcription factor IBH1, partial [Cucurbita argyrosperma subsp. argyrosperma]